ncbi:unnamed protein product [Caenorhabditis brenneri]
MVPTVKDEPYLGITFECMPYHHGKRPIDVELLSGGEKKVASVAFLLALNLSSRAHRSLYSMNWTKLFTKIHVSRLGLLFRNLEKRCRSWLFAMIF